MFETCPWCGTPHIKDPDNWKIGSLNNRKAIVGICPETTCLFNDESGIPFTCVDEDIYNNPLLYYWVLQINLYRQRTIDSTMMQQTNTRR